VKLVHAADLHLDSPLLGLERYEGAPVERIRSATRRAFSNLIDLCLEERAEFLLLAGDLFDDDWRDYSTGLFFVSQLSRLLESGTRVLFVRGNHDAASHITRNLRLPEHVIELASRAPDTRLFDDLGVAVHGKSYAQRAEQDNLALAYPEAFAGYFNIGLLHTSVSGRPGHEPYAPCSVADLASKGYDYWALGHVHQREVLSTAPWIVFPGNLQGRHWREPGSKGATLVELEGGLVQRVEHRDLSVVRFVDVALESALEADADTVCEGVSSALQAEVAKAEGRTLVVRVTLRGATKAHNAFQLEAERWDSEIRARSAEHSDVWLSRVRFATRPALDTERVLAREDAVGQVLRAVRDARANPSRSSEFAELFQELAQKLPAEVRSGAEGLKLDDEALLQELLEEVEQLLLAELLEEPD
jgi:DNA repair protein SbcD/Mre11